MHEITTNHQALMERQGKRGGLTRSRRFRTKQRNNALPIIVDEETDIKIRGQLANKK